jgi:hypothetical protein
MASEPFEVTDDNGNRVTGTVDVYPNPEGPYFDPTQPEFYMNPRYADAHFDYLNTREACTIDRKALSEAMQQAFRKALEKFKMAGPNLSKIRDGTLKLRSTQPGNSAFEMRTSMSRTKHSRTQTGRRAKPSAT